MLQEYPTKVCNMCGKTFDLWDHQGSFCCDQQIGYGSIHDFEHIQLNLCCQCFDKVLDWLLPQCKHNPISISREGLEIEINHILYALKMDPTHRDFQWLKEVILLAVYNPNTWQEIYLELIGQRESITRESVRYFLHKTAWDRWTPRSAHILSEYFGHPIQMQFERVKPTHIEFISLLSEKLRKKYKILSEH